MALVCPQTPRPRSALGFSALLAVVAALSGCTFETTSMTVQLDWGSSQSTCYAAGVASMSYTLYDSVGAVSSRNNVPCGDLSFSSLTIDNYDIDVYGYNSSGAEVYAATCTGMYFDGNDITHRCTVPASGDPLRVQLNWDLARGPDFVLGTCAQAGVDDYDVLLSDASGNVISSSVNNPCVGSSTLVLDFGTQPPGTYTLEIDGYEGNVAYWFGSCSVTPSAFGQRSCDVYQ